MGAAAARAKQKGPEDLRKQKRPGGPQRTKKGPQTLTGRIWDIRHISCLKKRCDLSVSAGTLSIAQFVRSYNPILEIYPNFFWRCADRGNFAAFFPDPAEPVRAAILSGGAGERRKERVLPAKARPKAECGGAAPAFSGPERGEVLCSRHSVRREGRSSGEQRDRPRKRRRAFRAKASRPGVEAGKVIHIGGDFDGGRGNVIFRRRAKAGRCSKQRGNPHKLEEERGGFSVILETPKGPRKGFFRPREPGSGVVHRNPHEQVFLWITLWISG